MNLAWFKFGKVSLYIFRVATYNKQFCPEKTAKYLPLLRTNGPQSIATADQIILVHAGKLVF